MNFKKESWCVFRKMLSIYVQFLKRIDKSCVRFIFVLKVIIQNVPYSLFLSYWKLDKVLFNFSKTRPLLFYT